MVNWRPIRKAPGDAVGRRRCRHRPRPFWRHARRSEKGRKMAKIFSSLEKGPGRSLFAKYLAMAAPEIKRAMGKSDLAKTGPRMSQKCL